MKKYLKNAKSTVLVFLLALSVSYSQVTLSFQHVDLLGYKV